MDNRPVPQSSVVAIYARGAHPSMFPKLARLGDSFFSSKPAEDLLSRFIRVTSGEPCLPRETLRLDLTLV